MKQTLTKAQRLKDETVLAAIITGGEASGRLVWPSTYGRNLAPQGCGFGADTTSGPCCAVGAGILYAGIQASRQTSIVTFARVHGVSPVYACGVSDGFEDNVGTTNMRIVAYNSRESESEDYLRGWAVGEAAFEWSQARGTAR